jgi:hypothetical protein
MNPYLSCAVLACFEGENQGGQPAGQPNGDQQPPAAPDGYVSQERVNQILADDRRKHGARVAAVEKAMSELMESKNLTEQQREQLAQQVEELRATSRTKEEQLEHQKKQVEEQYQRKLKELEAQGKNWEQLYRDSTIERALQDAAVKHDAFNPQQFVTQLRHMTRLEKPDAGKPTGKVVVDFPEQNPETGETTVTPLSPDQAAKRMKAMPEQFGNLWRASVISGIGSGSGAGVPSGNGKVDPRKLTMQQYLEIREKNPAALGLRPKNNGRRL